MALPWLRQQEPPAGIPAHGASRCQAGPGQRSASIPRGAAHSPGAHPSPAFRCFSAFLRRLQEAGNRGLPSAPRQHSVLPTDFPPPRQPSHEHMLKGKVRGWGLTHTHTRIEIYIHMGRELQPPLVQGTGEGGVGGGSGMLQARESRGLGGHPGPVAASGSEPGWATNPSILSDPSRSG